jgi:thiamine-monophosphate kinase
MKPLRANRALKPIRLSDLGEDRLVARLTRGLPVNPGLKLGPGDDCAVTSRPGEKVLTLLKTDCVIEGVHFTADADFRRVGWKALARAVSDIAAMGGEPEHALISVAFPPTLEADKADALYAGLRRCARKFGIAIAGGETARVPTVGEPPAPGPIFVAVTLTGRVEKKHLITRSGGKPGDLLYVTGRLGGSLSGKHLDFMPRLAEARWLVAYCRPRAMMDLSDGLGADLPRLAKASGCGFEIDDLPLTPGCTREQALADGEDFELLFAVAPRQAAKLEKAWPFPKLPLTRIGHLVANPSRRTGNKSTPVHGFDHFASSPGNL